jgi:alkanesulfonate monooxygenase SsuD/methylene tetrahydromethanopterin reductase-like flavin-dependent oxidoreductase (luciferase family)
MRLGLLYSQRGSDGSFTPLVEQIVAADALGFDTVWIEERPCEPRSLGSVAIVLAALAKRTRAIRLGAFKTMALGHPARIAEDFAMIDLLSGGRFNFGAAVNGSRDAFRAYRVPFTERGERFREALDIVLAAWACDAFAYGGRHYQFPAHTAPGSGLQRKSGNGPYRPQWERGPELPDFLTVTPKPLQEPHPPVWILAEDADQVTFAAERGHSLAMPAADLHQLEVAANSYAAALARVHRDRHEVELAAIVDIRLAGRRTAPGTLEELHRVQAATGMNHIIWRVPPDAAHNDLMGALSQFASEVQPMLQA